MPKCYFACLRKSIARKSCLSRKHAFLDDTLSSMYIHPVCDDGINKLIKSCDDLSKSGSIVIATIST
jgi:hypothetical protein